MLKNNWFNNKCIVQTVSQIKHLDTNHSRNPKKLEQNQVSSADKL